MTTSCYLWLFIVFVIEELIILLTFFSLLTLPWIDFYCFFSNCHSSLSFSMNSVKTIAKIVCKEDSSLGKSIFRVCSERTGVELIENDLVQKCYQ